MSPFTWLLWAILAIPVLLTLGAVIIVIVSGIAQAKHPGNQRHAYQRDPRTSPPRPAYQRDLLARQQAREAANKRADATLAALKRDQPGDAPADLSWLDKKDGLT